MEDNQTWLFYLTDNGKSESFFFLLLFARSRKTKGAPRKVIFYLIISSSIWLDRNVEERTTVLKGFKLKWEEKIKLSSKCNLGRVSNGKLK